MALTDGTDTTMLVQPSGVANGFGNDWAWIIILLLAFGGGFGGGFGGNNYDFPWLMNGQNSINANTNAGFQNALLNDGIVSVRDGIAGISNQLCSGFAGTTAAVTGAQNALAQQMYSNQIAELERSYAAQTANTAGLSNISAQLAQCCCDNRLATVQTQNVVSNEGAATRLAIQEQTQAILDKLCAQEIDQLKQANINLQNQVNMQALAASQAAQTAALVADNTAQTQYIVNRVAPYPIPAYTVANPVTPATGA